MRIIHYVAGRASYDIARSVYYRFRTWVIRTYYLRKARKTLKQQSEWSEYE